MFNMLIYECIYQLLNGNNTSKATMCKQYNKFNL